MQERQEMAKVIGDISNNAINIATYNEREKINKLGLEKFKLEEQEKALKGQAGNEQQLAAIKQQLTSVQTEITKTQGEIDRTYGIGSEKGMAIRAVTAALQAAVQNDTAGSLVALASPYLNKTIHEMTAGDTAKDKAANLMAHALLSAVEFQVTGKDPLTGAVAGVTGEATAEIIARAYGKPVSELTANEKENISTLSQLAGGLASALTAKANGTTTEQGGNFLAATSGAGTAKRAVENNYLYNGEVNSLVKELAKAEKEGRDTKPIFEKYAKLSEKNRQEILKRCGNNPACYIPHIQMMQSGDEAAYENFSYLRLGTYFNNLSRETQVKLSDFVESENGKTRNQLPKSVHYATFVLGAAEAAGLGGLALKTKLPKSANANEKLPIVGETKGYRTTKVNLNNLEIEISKQNKHLENTNEYKVSLANGQQKSIITVSLDSLKGYVGTGQQVGKTEIGLPGSKERVNFNKNIGIYIDPVTGNQTPTTMGIIHYSKNGYHVVPAKPKE
ncbi:polymorphic toxin type 50 domain-containing protein [Haemophilus haemolyticus]|uniref:polymorphic toxin type 50 domain-containing protein n=1 Tax=Haemophilus haemolyticus TaxID=726 RepID=UPI000E58D2CF|nr:polymorphic toxin type 50 domain-containing protein [Haemophilus haemolyticus]